MLKLVSYEVDFNFFLLLSSFLNRENTYNYIVQRTPANFNRNSPKINPKILKSLFSYIFWDKCFKLGSYVLGTKTKLNEWMNNILISSDRNFNLGLRSENVEFWKLPVPIFEGFWASGYFQNSIFSLLRPKSNFRSLESCILVPKFQAFISKNVGEDYRC